LSNILTALGPIFLLIVLGYWLRRERVAPDAFWAPAEWMTFHVFFPALLFRNISAADVGGTANVLALGAASLAGVLAVALIVRGLRDRLGVDGPAYTSVFQGAMRPNVYLGIAVAFSLFGETGIALLSVCIAVLVPTVNLLGVIVLVRHAGTDQAATWRQSVRPVLKNPLIIACLAGGLMNGLDLSIPPVVDPLLDILGKAALPLALLAVGAGLDLGAVRRDAATVALISAFKIAFLPALTWTACVLLGVDGMARTIAVMYAALPGSGSAYVLARQMGGDAVLLAGSITATTIISAATLPLILRLLAP
jgi:predicted permease